MDWNKLLSNKRLRKGTTRLGGDIRTDFESDFGRIIFSPALRRMHDKTQVFPLTTDDNIHTRLTHSNEVMSIGFTLGLKLSESEKIKNRLNSLTDIELYRIFPTLLKNICLIHDIGNAPFGHFAEKIFSNYFKELFNNNEYFKEIIASGKLNKHQIKDFTNYDGNAQGFRVLTKLQILNDIYGLNLTFGTLSAYIKYPNYKFDKKSEENSSGSERIEDKKHGVFFSELIYFENIMAECGLSNKGEFIRNPICYLMEAADSIAYLCMDLEDGYNKGLVCIEDIKKVINENLDIKFPDREKLMKIFESKDRPNSKIVTLRIFFISFLVKKAFENFENNLELIENGTYNKELIDDDEYGITKSLKKLTYEYILQSREINYLESTGYSIITGILDFFIEFIFIKKGKDFSKRAVALISRSLIDCAIEENIDTIILEKKSKIENKFNAPEKDKLYTEYINLKNQLNIKEFSVEEKELYYDLRAKIYNDFELEFYDLNDYYKLRVIVDFVSGMTDKFALNFYKRISGTEIA